MSGASAATRSTTSRQNSSGIAASNSAWDIVPNSARDGIAAAALAGPREPQPPDVLLGQHHRGVEADDREPPRDVEDRLDHLLADRGLA